MSGKFTAYMLALTLFMLPLYAYAGEPLSLMPLLEEANKNNPDILAARKRWEASLVRVPIAKSLDDPSVGLTFEKIPKGTLKLSSTMPDDRMLTVSQFLPFFGKLALKGKIALIESQIAAAEFKDKQLEIANKLSNAYYELFMKQKELELSKESLALLEGVAGTAEAKYAVSEISQEQLYKIHLEAAKLDNRVKTLEQESFSKKTRLNAILNREPESALGDLQLDEKADYNPEAKALYEQALINRPELLVLSYAIEKNKNAKSLAQRSFFPDLMASIVQRGITSGTLGPWDLMLSFTVPFWFWSKQKYQVKEAIANLDEAKAAYKAMQNNSFAEVQELVSGIIIEKNKIKLYKERLLPLVEGSSEVSLYAFRSGKGDFMALLDNQRMIIDMRMEYYKSLVEFNRKIADLERVVGARLRE